MSKDPSVTTSRCETNARETEAMALIGHEGLHTTDRVKDVMGRAAKMVSHSDEMLAIRILGIGVLSVRSTRPTLQTRGLSSLVASTYQ